MSEIPEGSGGEIERIKKLTAGSPAVETILNIFKATLSTVPYCGGVVSLITDYIPSRRFIRVEQFAKDVADDILLLKDKINSDYIKTDDFAFMFEQCFRGVAENPQKEKLDAFRAMLINSMIVDISWEEKEYFLNLVNTLSVLHIRILKFLSKPRVYLAEAGIPEEKITGGFSDFFPMAIPGIEIEVIKSAFGDLNKYGLINTDPKIFVTMTSGQGLNLLGNRASNLGEMFIDFCTVHKP
jgi:hypothetical protein